MSPRVSLWQRRPAAFLAALILCVFSSGLSAAQFKWMVGDKSVKYQSYRDAAGRFELEYPEKDWKRLPSVGQSLVGFARNDGPTLFVDHLRLVSEFTAAELAGLPALELSTLKDQQPKATGFKTEDLESKAGHGVLIRYSREGSGPETVIQFSIAVGQELFRISGVLPDKQVAKYEPVVMYMIQSFKAPAAASPSKH
jgi:hypothetical protein